LYHFASGPKLKSLPNIGLNWVRFVGVLVWWAAAKDYKMSNTLSIAHRGVWPLPRIEEKVPYYSVVTLRAIFSNVYGNLG